MNTLEIPHFFREKCGLKGYALFFLIWLKNKDFEYSLEPPYEGAQILYNFYQEEGENSFI